ncbi:MAG: hypothetical protein ABL999_07140 [Pyrinomonadaceae bacterium]
MKRYLILFNLAMMFGFSLLANLGAQSLGDQQPSVVNPNMSVRFAIDKVNYQMMEPIVIRWNFINETDSDQTTLVPDLSAEGRLMVGIGEEEKEFNQLSRLSAGLARRPNRFSPSKGIQDEFLLEMRLDEYFPKAGNYSIRLAIVVENGAMIYSNYVNIKIEEPTGIDKKAYDFILRNKSRNKFPAPFFWDNAPNKDGLTLLEEFVKDFGSSSYGADATFKLGGYYYAIGKYAKAKNQFEKVRNSPNIRIARSAMERLENLEKSGRLPQNNLDK